MGGDEEQDEEPLGLFTMLVKSPITQMAEGGRACCLGWEESDEERGEGGLFVCCLLNVPATC